MSKHLRTPNTARMKPEDLAEANRIIDEVKAAYATIRSHIPVLTPEMRKGKHHVARLQSYRRTVANDETWLCNIILADIYDKVVGKRDIGSNVVRIKELPMQDKRRFYFHNLFLTMPLSGSKLSRESEPPTLSDDQAHSTSKE